MFPTAKPSERIATVAVYNPASVSASTVTTGWVKGAAFHEYLVTLFTGVLGTSATVDAKLEQATDSSGTSAKDISGKAITQIVKASGDNKQALINFRTSDFDVNGGFGYFRLSITVGTAASIVGAIIQGIDPDNYPASGSNAASVVQIV